MLTRVSARRFTAALHLVWFALYVGAPQLVHPCPEHAAPGLAAETVAKAPSGGHAHHGDPSPASDAKGDDCCCPGPQCGVAAMVASSDRAVSPGVISPCEGVPRFERARGPRSRTAHVLPFATAPPSRSA